MTKFIKFFAIISVVLGLTAFTLIFVKAHIDGFSAFTTLKTDYQVTGQFGDFVGGIVGTCFALTGTLLLYLTLRNQTEENKHLSFESKFFEMIRLHRENISEISYSKYDGQDKEKYENRQALRVIFQEFIECFREVTKFSNSDQILDYITPKYHETLKTQIANTHPHINLIELARIDIAFSIVFYGLGEEGELVLRKIFQNKYNPDYYFKLLFYIKLKPKKENTGRFRNWTTARNLSLKELKNLIEELYSNRKTPEKTEDLSDLAAKFRMHAPYEKYYGGHQFRLSHYFRHLYQSFKYLHGTQHLTSSQKYGYAKILRAQLSTYEQALLFINSISGLGRRWELLSETSETGEKLNLITNFNLIKNLPGEHLDGIRYKTYYKKIEYETDENAI